MNVARPLYLFTQAFPHGGGETFLETEIRYLAAAFPRVTVVPLTATGEARELPRGVAVDTSLALGTGPRAATIGRAASGLAKPLAVELSRLGAHPGRRNTRGLRRVLRFARAAERIVRWYEEARPPEGAIFYSYWFEAVPVGLAAIGGLAFVARAHRWDLYEELYTPPFFPFRDVVLERASAVFPVSEHGARHLRGRFPRAASKIEVARLGVEDLGENPPSTGGVFRIASCSGLVAVKRVHLVIEAIAELARGLPERAFEWRHLGGGPLRAELEARAARSLPANVTWSFSGLVPNRAIAEHYRTHPVDVFVAASASEGVPVAIMEAQSAGIPAVATDAGGTGEIVSAENGVLLPLSAGPAEIAAALAGLLPERGRAPELRAASKATWRRLSDARSNFEAFAQRLQQI